LPIGYVNRRNEDAFATIDRSMIAMLAQNRGVSVQSPADAGLQQINPDVDTGPEVTPLNTVSILQMNKIAWEIAQNVTLESKVMERSWRDFPKGKDENVDALRQRLQNMMDLQNALENKIMSFTETSMDNSGMADQAANATQFASMLQASVYGQLAALAEARSQKDPEMAPAASASEIAKYGTQADIVKQLRLQEIAFSSEITKAGNTCGI
jgi:hypothetical protein